MLFGVCQVLWDARTGRLTSGPCTTPSAARRGQVLRKVRQEYQTVEQDYSAKKDVYDKEKLKIDGDVNRLTMEIQNLEKDTGTEMVRTKTMSTWWSPPNRRQQR